MDEDYVKIGKNVNRGAGGPRESVVKGKSAINAAHRSGNIVGTEKKFATGNSVCFAGEFGDDPNQKHVTIY